MIVIDQNRFILKQQLSFADIYAFEGKNIVLVDLKDGVDIELKEAKEIIVNVKTVANPDEKCFGITKIGKGTSANQEARNYFANCKFTVEQTEAMATVFNDLASRLLYNFYITINKPKIKNKGFSSIEDAIEWLIKSGA